MATLARPRSNEPVKTRKTRDVPRYSSRSQSDYETRLDFRNPWKESRVPNTSDPPQTGRQSPTTLRRSSASLTSLSPSDSISRVQRRPSRHYTSDRGDRSSLANRTAPSQNTRPSCRVGTARSGREVLLTERNLERLNRSRSREAVDVQAFARSAVIRPGLGRAGASRETIRYRATKIRSFSRPSSPERASFQDASFRTFKGRKTTYSNAASQRRNSRTRKGTTIVDNATISRNASSAVPASRSYKDAERTSIYQDAAAETTIRQSMRTSVRDGPTETTTSKSVKAERDVRSAISVPKGESTQNPTVKKAPSDALPHRNRSTISNSSRRASQTSNNSAQGVEKADLRTSSNDECTWEKRTHFITKRWADGTEVREREVRLVWSPLP